MTSGMSRLEEKTLWVKYGMMTVDEEEWLEAETEGETRASHGAGVIYVDDGDVCI